ncbi:Phage tail protein [Vibrio crassostreae]|uniref:phage tail assembly chaperone n=1 Tax=Vibrio crassostreae TaxID=246167 RepID=UPI001B302AEB|nr:phage tail assembly chaperone [Vibrio crassostreae]CAK1817950.1 Phage tail protein [Vibrio crassostreae]CAK1818035.1 Phage tail protein [Vibrio crassostreae]CAK1879694.1 Phage tail protein [Vibrio crassostreae]CAK1880047.1 Phage tail protein [Vibrio crassostreae]CAK1893929.1 Phage tail protein [Vibrio crassostreae]
MSLLIVTNRGLVSDNWVEIIEQRDCLMVDADHLVNSAMDNGVDATPFRQYRQALRDIPQTYTNPEDVVWPQKPSLPQASV